MRAWHSVASTLSSSVRILFLQIVQEQLQGFLWSLRNRRDKRMGHIRGCRRCPPIALAAKALKSVAALLDQLFKMQRRRPSAWAAPSFWALRVPRQRLKPGFRRNRAFVAQQLILRSRPSFTRSMVFPAGRDTLT